MYAKARRVLATGKVYRLPGAAHPGGDQSLPFTRGADPDRGRNLSFDRDDRPWLELKSIVCQGRRTMAMTKVCCLPGAMTLTEGEICRLTGTIDHG